MDGLLPGLEKREWKRLEIVHYKSTPLEFPHDDTTTLCHRMPTPRNTSSIIPPSSSSTLSSHNNSALLALNYISQIASLKYMRRAIALLQSQHADPFFSPDNKSKSMFKNDALKILIAQCIPQFATFLSLSGEHQGPVTAVCVLQVWNMEHENLECFDGRTF
jgi:hypothetical protein